jgi:adenine deaminase
MDAVVRKAILLGLDPVRAIQLATINAAERFGLKEIGAVGPGYLANLLVMQDLNRFEAGMVFHRGRLVAREGRALFNPANNSPKNLTRSIKVKPFRAENLSISSSLDTFPVIGVVPGQITTLKLTEPITRDAGGKVLTDLARDILKIVVVERHKRSGNIGRGLVKGFGLKRGAVASSVAHDSHNIVAVGATDTDIFRAISEIISMHGGMAVVEDGRVIARLKLQVAGIISDKPLVEVVDDFERLENSAKSLGTTLEAPFAALSFLALPVIPEIRLTDRGLVDMATFKFIKP